MERYTVQILPYSDISAWSELLSKNRLVNINREAPIILNVDLSNLEFIRPHQMVSLACLIEEYYKMGSKIEFSIYKSSQVQNYLNRAGFFNYWKEGFDRKAYHQTQVSTSLCLWQIDREMIHPYVSYAQDYFKNNFFSGKDAQPLNTSLAELFNNVMDHSASEVSGYVYTQFYPKLKQISISLCDFGNGIPHTVNKFLIRKGKRSLAETDALTLAFEKGFSTESTPHNRGFGLNNIASLVKTLKSELMLISNYATLRQLPDGNIVKESESVAFPGTLVVITLDTAQLSPLIMEDIVDNADFIL